MSSMKPTLLLFCALSAGLLPGCSGDTPQELINTAQFEEQQHNLPHAKQLYDDVIRLYPSSKQADVARVRLAQLNSGQ
jgi:outer membrane biogenesis lipoprotein LolB